MVVTVLLVELNFRAADMSLSSVRQNKSDIAPTGDMSAKNQRSKKTLRK